jgi:Leucine-rich repeat (LRR) protein
VFKHIQSLGASALTRLEISACKLQRIPQQLQGLTALVDLRLGSNKLGEGPPGSFLALQGLSQLTRLDLSYNPLPGLPSELSALKSLQALDVHGKLIKKSYMGALLPATWDPLMHLTALTWLDVRATTPWIPHQLSVVQSLRDLRFGCMNCYPFFASALNDERERIWDTFEFLHPLSALTRLDLDSSCMERLPPCLSALTALAHLSLRGSDLAPGDDARSKLGILQQCTSLTRVDLTRARVRPEHLPSWVAELETRGVIIGLRRPGALHA